MLQNIQAHVTDLSSVKELGRGAYGVVEKMVHNPSGVEMAVKVGLEEQGFHGTLPAS